MKTSFLYRCALLLLNCYPRTWRERYADEAVAVLEERPVTLITLCDLLLGMFDAHLHMDLFTERKFAMAQRVRTSQINIFCSCLVFWIPLGMYIFLSTTWLQPYWYFTNTPCPDAAQALQCYSPVPSYAYNWTFSIANLAGLCAALVGLAGGITLITLVRRQALAHHDQRFAKRLRLWLFSTLAFVVLTIAWPSYLTFYNSHQVSISFNLLSDFWMLFHQGIEYLILFARLRLVHAVFFSPLAFLDFAVQCIWGLFLIWVICIASIRLLLAAKEIEVAPEHLHGTSILTTLVSCALLVVLAMMIFQIIQVDLHMPGALYVFGRHAPLLLSIFHAIFGCVALLTAFSCASFWRGMKARRVLAHAS